MEIAWRLRPETTMTLKWIAKRLSMGAWTHVSNCPLKGEKQRKIRKSVNSYYPYLELKDSRQIALHPARYRIVENQLPLMSVTAKINNALLGWSKDALYPWQHEALRRILTKGALSEQDKADIYERAQFDLGFTLPPPNLPNILLTEADLPAGLAQANRIHWHPTGGKSGGDPSVLRRNAAGLGGSALRVLGSFAG